MNIVNLGVRIMSIGFILASGGGLTGCSSIDRFGSKLAVVPNHWTQPSSPLAEGRVERAQRVGDMTSIQFSSGDIFDVSEAPSALEAGDVVRIYKTDKGEQAILWNAGND